MTIFSTALKRWRYEQSLSQAEAAAKLAVSLRTFQEWEQARREPSGVLWPVLAPILYPQNTLNGSFVEMLKRYRKQTRQNRRDAAKSLNVSAGAIQDWEQERRVPNGATLARLLPLFQAAAEKWNRALSAPQSAEESRLIADLRRCSERSRSRKRVFADPREGRKKTLEWLKHARHELKEACSKNHSWQEQHYLQERIRRLECELARYKRKIAADRAKANRTKRRIALRKPRRKSPVLPSLPE